MADPLRIATWHVELTRRGPGLLLRDILKGEDPQIAIVAETLTSLTPDIVLLTGIDWDYDLQTLTALNDVLTQHGTGYNHRIALRPNAGLATTLDLDGDGRTGGPGDAQGYGRFIGHGGMAILSRYPIDSGAAQDFSGLLWADFPGALLPSKDGLPFPSKMALAQQRLASVGHWDVPVRLPDDTALHLLTLSANPPVFDGPEDRNGKRNHDEVVFWARYLDETPPSSPVVVLGNANLDPVDGEGLKDAIDRLLTHPRLQDPRPASEGAVLAAQDQAGVNTGHRGNPALDTADWSDESGPGNLRVGYVLPDAGLAVVGAGVAWSWPDIGAALQENALRHHLVWVDLEF